MQKKLFLKLLIIGALMLLIGMPLLMVQATIDERMSYRVEAVRSIASDSVGEQSVIGPVLVIPYTEEVDERSTSADGKPLLATRSHARLHLVYPNELRVDGKITPERRYRGIHQVLVYSGQYAFSGDFTLPLASDLPRSESGARVKQAGQPYVSLPIEDVRGLRDIPRIAWNGATLEFEQGARLGPWQRGLHVRIGDQAQARSEQVKFSFALNLAGTERQQFTPVGKNNLFTLASSWPHPQFGGRFLPEQRSVAADGFKASWRVPALASNVQQELAATVWHGKARPAIELDRFSVAFVEPVNVYSMADRATKYGLLFIALTFAAFFMLEILKRLPIHPIQYGLVGLALVLFFLLLVSLSEHIDFLAAYLTASGACIVLDR